MQRPCSAGCWQFSLTRRRSRAAQTIYWGGQRHEPAWASGPRCGGAEIKQSATSRATEYGSHEDVKTSDDTRTFGTAIRTDLLNMSPTRESLAVSVVEDKSTLDENGSSNSTRSWNRRREVGPHLPCIRFGGNFFGENAALRQTVLWRTQHSNEIRFRALGRLIGKVIWLSGSAVQ
jgi:hypothetical protein